MYSIDKNILDSFPLKFLLLDIFQILKEIPVGVITSETLQRYVNRNANYLCTPTSQSLSLFLSLWIISYLVHLSSYKYKNKQPYVNIKILFIFLNNF